MTKKKVITKENNVRIKDGELISRLNTAFTKFDIGDTSKNAFLVYLLKLGLNTYQKQWKDNWAIKNETTTIYKQDIEMSENDIKKLPFDFSFKRQLSGGESGI